MKKALLIGINYIGTPNELKGCINDVTNMRTYLKTECGYDQNNILLVTELTAKRPTKQNIFEAISWLVNGAKSGDTLFFHYSGHGGSTIDRNGDEDDGRDETIFPLDGTIVDDDLKKALIDPLPSGVKLFALFDSCHSGTVLDLKYNYKVDANPLTTSYTTNISKKYKDANANVVLFSGCLDNQTSADTFEANQACGAMTYGLLESLKKLKGKGKIPTYKNLFKNLSVILKQKGYQQIPQMSSGKLLSLDNSIII